ncbi:MAG: DUF4292 domain-containing protein [Flavobacteriales bacterium]|nr:DUF4292 domain-containing protein [Flavobacteriales bacterium]
MTAKRLNIFKHLGLFLSLIVLLGGCRKQREAVIISGPATPNFITRNMEANMLQYDWITAKVSTEADMNGEKMSFKTNLRMRKDSIIWMSISPALGIEVARMIVTPDSVKFIDKWNDKYYLGTHDFIEERINVDLDFQFLQDLAVGNPILYDSEGKFKGTKDDEGYVLTSRSKAKVRKITGVKYTRKNAEAMEDTIVLDVDEKRYDKVIEKFDEDNNELILKRYWVGPDNFKVIRTIVNDLLNLRSIQADYEKFEEVEGQFIPVKMNYKIVEPTKQAGFRMEYTRVKLDKATTFPFTIPEKFVKIE